MANTERFQAVIEVNKQKAEASVKQLEREVKAATEEVIKLKKKDSGATKEQIAAAERKLKVVTDALKKEEKHVKGLSKAMDDLSQKNYKELQAEVRSLNRLMRDGSVTKNSKEWNALAERIKAAKREMNEYTAATVQSKSIFSRFFKFLNDSWGGVLILFQSITGISQTVRNSVADYAKMEEAMADTRKYTGMTEAAVRDLNEELKKMDTRTSREELNELAGAAGRLGKTSKKDILEFVEAGNMIKVALGDDLGEGAIDSIGKLAMAFGEDDKMGLRGAMLATGSAVNELAQNSSANAGYLVDFTARVAGFGKQMGLTQAQIMGFGAVMDENLLRDEMAATAFGNMLVKMQTDTAKFAKIAGMDVKKFADLVKTDANGAVLALADSLKRADPQTMMKMLDDMGLDGSRAVGVLSTLADKIDDVRARQQLATQAYREAKSVTEEYNVMNNTAEAELDKAKNAFHELSVELGERLKPVVTYTISAGGLLVKTLLAITTFLGENGKAVLRYATYIAMLTAIWKAQTIALKAETALLAMRTAVQKSALAVEKAFAAAAMFTRNVLLALQLTWTLLTKGVQAYTVALRAAKMASLTNPWTALATVLLTVGVAIYEITSRMNENAEAAKKAKDATNEFVLQQQVMKSVNEEANKSVAEELSRFKQLRKTLEDNKAKLEDRKKALAEIKKIVPEYHGQLTAENRLINSNTSALDGYITNLIRAARARAAFNKMTEIQENSLGHEQLLQGRRDNQKWVDKQLAQKGLVDGNQLQYNGYGGTYSIVNRDGKFVKSITREEGRQIEHLQNLEKYNTKRIEQEQTILRINQKNTEFLEKQVKLNGGGSLLTSPTTPTVRTGGGGGTYTGSSNKGKGGSSGSPKAETARKKLDAEQRKAYKKEMDAAKAHNAQMLALNTMAYAQGDVDYLSYLDNHHQLTLEGYDRQIAVAKKFGQETGEIEKKKADEILKYEQEITKAQLSEIRRRTALEKAAAKVDFNDRSSVAYQNEDLLNERLFQIEMEGLRQRLAVTGKGTQEYFDIQSELTERSLQHQSDLHEKYIERLQHYREQFGMQDFKAQENAAILGINNMYQELVKTGEMTKEELQELIDKVHEYYAALQQGQDSKQAKFDEKVSSMINKAKEGNQDGYDPSQGLSFTNNPFVGLITNYRDTMAKLKELYGEDKENHAAYQQAKAEVTAEFLTNMVSQVQTAYDSVNQVMQAASSYYAAQSQYEQNVTAAKYDKEIEKAGNNEKKRKKLEEKKQKEMAAIKSKYNKKQMKIEIAQAIASTAMAAINAYASASKVSWILGPIAAAMATAAGMIQIAAIKKQHQAEEAGYYQGGFTGGKDYKKEAGVVHQGEFVANHEAVNNRNLQPLFSLLDHAQRNNSIGSLTGKDVTNVMGGPAAASVIAPVINVQVDNTELQESLKGMNGTVEKLTDYLEDPKPAVVSMEQLDREWRRWERIKNR